jgi:cysteine desulfurase family protein (TIGR01976 family)
MNQAIAPPRAAAWSLDEIRAQFPSLAMCDNGAPRIHLDNPAGTQAPRQVIDRIVGYLTRSNANKGGPFVTAQDSDAVLAQARAAMAAFLGARTASEIVFGPNMTSLTFQLSRALGQRLQPGDEILLSRMDHDGNVTPWVRLAERHGAIVRWLDFSPETFRYDLTRLDALIGPRTRIAAFTYASNVIGTINDVAAIVQRAREAGALTYVDAVQFAPHGAIDVQALGCDVLVCSAYKFYGPHVGVLWGRRDLLAELAPDRLEAAPPEAPYKFETGTQNHEGIAGVLGAAEYFAQLGGAAPGAPVTAEAITRAKLFMQAQEAALARRLISGLRELRGVRILGLQGANEMLERVSTVSVAVEGRDPAALARGLAARNIFVWAGHNYALQAVARLGLSERGGVLRLGPVHYNTEAEIDATLAALEDLLGAGG